MIFCPYHKMEFEIDCRIFDYRPLPRKKFMEIMSMAITDGEIPLSNHMMKFRPADLTKLKIQSRPRARSVISFTFTETSCFQSLTPVTFTDKKYVKYYSRCYHFSRLINNGFHKIDIQTYIWSGV